MSLLCGHAHQGQTFSGNEQRFVVGQKIPNARKPTLSFRI